MCLTEKDCLKKYDIKLVIISRSRYTSISTNRLLPDWVEVLVPESEKEQYEAVLKNPIITIPDDQEGLGMVRNWCLKHFKEETVIMLDDDIDICYCLTGKLNRRVEDPEELVQILINTAVMAKDMGVKCFGYAQTDIIKYNGCEPFYLSRWIGCVVGVIGRKYEFRNDKYKVDIDFVLQNLLVERIVLQDARYYFSQKRNLNKGGNSLWRTEEEFNRSVESLKQKWGECINVDHRHQNDIRISLNVERKQKIDYR